MVTGDGAVLVFHRAYSGGAGEVGQVTAAMRACRELAARAGSCGRGLEAGVLRQPAGHDRGRGGVHRAASKTYVAAADLAALDRAAATEVDYVAQRDAQVPPEARGRWAVCEDTTTIRGKRTRDPVLVLRRVFVHSGARAAAAACARAKKLDRARDDLDRLGRGSAAGTTPTRPRSRPGRGHRPRPSGRRLPPRRCGYRSGHRETTLAWSFDQAALDAEAATDGWYALLTNLPATVDAAGCCVATRARRPWSAATARSKGRWPWPRCSARQSPDHRVDHRDLPGPADLLPGRTPGSNAIAPDTHLDGLGSGHRRARPRAADPHRPGLAATDPRRPRPASDHPAANRLQTRRWTCDVDHRPP